MFDFFLICGIYRSCGHPTAIVTAVTRHASRYSCHEFGRGRKLVLFLVLVTFVVFCMLLDFLNQTSARMTHKTGRFIEEMFAFVCSGSSNDYCLFHSQLFAGASARNRQMCLLSDETLKPHKV